jgi:hypothetical protein
MSLFSRRAKGNLLPNWQKKLGGAMKKVFFWLAFLWLLGCAEKPFKLNEQSNVKLPSHKFNGMVELGRPVSGAQVDAYKFSGLTRGEKVAEASNNPDGAFELDIKTDYDGPLLLVATGGMYQDPATDEMVAIKPGQELCSAITHIKMPEKTNINAWTTLAVARVQAQKGFWDKSVSDLKDEERINVDFSHMSYFLTGKSNNAINIRRQEIFDIDKDAFKLNDPRVVLYATHGGLSQLANTYTKKLSEDGNAISVIDLVTALSEDLSDRVFDGKKADDGTVFIGTNRRISLTSYTVRKDLSEAIFHYAKRLQQRGKISNDDLLELRSAGKLIDAIATDTRPELFPEKDRPLPFDIDIPKLSVSFSGKHEGERSYATLDGDVYFNASAEDRSKIAKITLVAPQLDKHGDEGDFGPISIDHQQNSMEVAIACDERARFQSELTMRRLKREDVFCACFEAVDNAENTERGLRCFQRERPIASILSPRDKLTLARADLQQGIEIEATVVSGIALKECFWSIYGRRSEVALLKGEGKIIGSKCVIAENIQKDKLRSGSYSLAIQATDIARRASNNGYLADFNVRHDMVRMPGRNIGFSP